jgi:RimJ/RimL family protein N-acetyltransferase
LHVIETRRLLIRNFRPEDWRDLQKYISREEVLRFEPHWNCSDEACQKAAQDFAVGNDFWAAELKGSPKMIGHVYFHQIEPAEFMTWDLGYIFNPDYHGRGYATEACRGVLRYGFANLKAHRVSAKCSPENVRSWKLMERLGMRREGHGLKCVTFIKAADGEPIWWDEYQYAILAEEWAEIDKIDSMLL